MLNTNFDENEPDFDIESISIVEDEKKEDQILKEMIENEIDVQSTISPLDIESISAATINDVKQQMKNLSAMCRRLKIPMFTAIAESNTVLGTKYASEAVTPFDLNVRLREDHISPMLLALNGFDVVDNDKVGMVEIEM